MLRLPLRFVALFSFFVITSPHSNAADPPAPEYKPFVAPASDEGQKAIKQFRLPAGVEVKLWAAEPLMANPVAFCFDEKGRCFLAETFRLHHGVTDNRSHMNWLDDDIACRTVADRVAMYKKYAKEKFASTYEKEHDRIRLIEDTKGAGVADKATVFADGFHLAEDGLGAGVLAHHGNLYYTCIPNLWLLKDTKGAGKADERDILATGFGVHVAFLGHDLHGLRIGPDGRLYFSCGDRGFNVKTKEGRQLFVPDCGAVLRCDLDGSNLEVVHTGLRNPQKLAFDQYGNLFTCDNNSDSGDQVRLVQIVEGGDSGWRMSYQYGTVMSDRGPFNAERIWHLQDQPLYIVPPLAHIASGPSGFCFNYGCTSLPEKYRDHFFLCDFRGGSTNSGVWSFAVKPKGASYEFVDREQFIWSILCTDCEFGPDGGLYVSDWVHGWDCTGKGRIYRFADPAAEKKNGAAEVNRLLADGFDKRSLDELAKLLVHPDMRVRQEAQFALASKGKNAIPVFARVAKSSKNMLARCHAIWGLGQLGRKFPEAGEAVFEQAHHPVPEIRIQAARVLRDFHSESVLRAMLEDADPRVAFEAALSISHLPADFSGPEGAHLMNLAQTHRAAVELLRRNADKDGYLRHAAVMILQTYPPELLKHSYDDESPSVRLGVVLALRRQKHPDIARFLNDSDPRLALEAARAIHDVPIPEGMPALAALITKSNSNEFWLWRVLNANFRLGEKKNAEAVADFACRTDVPEKLRIDAVKMLGDWTKPSNRDRLTGLYRLLPPRDPQIGADALRTHLGGIFGGSDKLRKEAAVVAAKLGIKEVGKILQDMVANNHESSAAKIEALKALDQLKDSHLNEVLASAIKSSDAKLRAEARSMTVRRQPEQAVALLEPILEKGTVVEQQAALADLASLRTNEAGALLARWLDKLLAGQVARELRLDLLLAANQRQNAGIPKKLKAIEDARLRSSDPIAPWSETLYGGDAEKGKNIFLNKAEVTCVKCHKLNGTGGDVGPELAGIGAKQTREYLLESIVFPDAKIAKGYDSVVLELTNGKTVTGVLKSEDDKEVKIMTAEGVPLTIDKNKIEERRRGKSPMPDDLHQKLTKRELRDLIEFLADLKTEHVDK
ncbi:MAG TPA: PVC-type heme-binding CxxCH protein [Gemmataceae bacterium]|nr:PVC-type heme-binding CxxCH protein [Gemmataceae bacterium]